MFGRQKSFGVANAGPGPTARSVPAKPDRGENSASTIVEAPLQGGLKRFEAHDFPDGGGSGGAEAFRRDRGSRAIPQPGHWSPRSSRGL